MAYTEITVVVDEATNEQVEDLEIAIEDFLKEKFKGNLPGNLDVRQDKLDLDEDEDDEEE